MSASDVLSNMVAAAFKSGGELEAALCARGRPFVQSPVQRAYADAVAATLSSPPGFGGADVSLLEAATGTGKSLGYLVPLALHLAQSGGRGLVATFTLQLLRQLCNREVPVAIDIAERLTGRRLTAQYRIGARNWLSPRRIADLRAKIQAADPTNEHLPLLDRMGTFALTRGELVQWEEANGPLPETIQVRDICLVSSTDPDTTAYETHVSLSRSADIVLTSQALLVADLALGNRLLVGSEDTPFNAAVVDEGDHLPGVIRNFYTAQVPASAVEHLASASGGSAGRNLLEQVDRFRQFMRSAYENQTATRSARLLYLHDGSRAALRAQAAKHAAMMVCAIGGLSLTHGGLEAQEAAEIEFGLNEFIRACTSLSDEQAPVLMWSAVLGYPALGVVPFRSGHVAARLWGARSALRGVVITSATLGAPGGTGDRFRDYRDDIGLSPRFSNYRADLSGEFEPEDFGRLTFWLSSSRAPAPEFGESELDGQVEASERWIAYVSDTVSRAAKIGDHVLVLTNSFQDSARLANSLSLSTCPSFVHTAGQRLEPILQAFSSSPRAVLVTPSAWEGVDLPGLLTDLVVTRIPFPARDNLRLRMLEDVLLSRGYSAEHARGAALALAKRVAARRLKQGFGRAIRTPSDACRIWITDPRFPLPDEIVTDLGRNETMRYPAHRRLSASIPLRFREGLGATYPHANIIPFDGAAPRSGS